MSSEIVVVYFPQLIKGISRFILKNSMLVPGCCSVLPARSAHSPAGLVVLRSPPSLLPRYPDTLISTLAAHGFPDLPDGDPLELAAAAVHQVHHAARDHDRAEYGRQNTQAKHYGKSLHGTRPKSE